MRFTTPDSGRLKSTHLSAPSPLPHHPSFFVLSSSLNWCNHPHLPQSAIPVKVSAQNRNAQNLVKPKLTPFRCPFWQYKYPSSPSSYSLERQFSMPQTGPFRRVGRSSNSMAPTLTSTPYASILLPKNISLSSLGTVHSSSPARTT